MCLIDVIGWVISPENWANSLLLPTLACQLLERQRLSPVDDARAFDNLDNGGLQIHRIVVNKSEAMFDQFVCLFYTEFDSIVSYLRFIIFKLLHFLKYKIGY